MVSSSLSFLSSFRTYFHYQRVFFYFLISLFYPLLHLLLFHLSSSSPSSSSLILRVPVSFYLILSYTASPFFVCVFLLLRSIPCSSISYLLLFAFRLSRLCPLPPLLVFSSSYFCFSTSSSPSSFPSSSSRSLSLSSLLHCHVLTRSCTCPSPVQHGSIVRVLPLILGLQASVVMALQHRSRWSSVCPSLCLLLVFVCF